MAKSYWVSAYRSIRDQEAFAAYARLAGPALEAAGGRFLARGMPARVYEGGLQERIVLLEFDSVAQAIAAHDSPGYQQALRALGNGADRDVRIVEGAG
jgi:uncharacterized protein (DUF1330 family)